MSASFRKYRFGFSKGEEGFSQAVCRTIGSGIFIAFHAARPEDIYRVSGVLEPAGIMYRTCKKVLVAYVSSMLD
jgi:hypothetical protein